jgi:hypothetical protein
VKTQYNIGESVPLFLYTRKNGVFFDVFSITQVEIKDKDDNVLTTITSPFDVIHQSTGVYKVNYQTLSSFTPGKYTATWSFKWTGYDSIDSTYEYEFELHNDAFSTDYGATYVLKFIYRLLNDTYVKGSKTFVRINVEELYGRVWSVQGAAIKVIRKINNYHIDTVMDWTECDWMNQEMVALFDCANAAADDNYYVQLKLSLTNGEIQMSPLFNIKVYDYSQIV